MKLLPIIFLFSFPVFSQTIHLKDYNLSVPDISEKNLTKESLYQKMDRTNMVRPKDSICSNRAHVWAFDFQKQDIVSPKIFLFFTPKTSVIEGVAWWYHVSPMVNEHGKLWVMDWSFPQIFTKPLSVESWLKQFNGEKSVCKEIEAGDHELIKLMNKEKSFPEITSYGKYNCYYKITPAGYWTPEQVAKNLLGKDANGRPVNFNRDVMEEGEVMQACVETSTSPFGWVLRTSKSRCRYFINH